MILAGSDQCCITHCGWVCISLAIVQLAWGLEPAGYDACMPVQEHEFRKGRLMNSLFFSAAGFPYRGEASKSAIHSARLTAPPTIRITPISWKLM